MKGKLVFVPDTHVVVPRDKPTDEMAEAFWEAPGDQSVAFRYRRMMAKVPQLTTQPVLRWEGKYLKFMDATLCSVTMASNGFFYFSANGSSYGEFIWSDEARRAAEKALGIEFEVEEV